MNMLTWYTGVKRCFRFDFKLRPCVECICYAMFVLLQMVHVGVLWTTRAENMKVVATGNLVLSLCIGFHYFIKVWSPAMHGHPPSTSQVGSKPL